MMTNIRMYRLNKAKAFPLINPKSRNHGFKTGTNKQLKQGNRYTYRESCYVCYGISSSFMPWKNRVNEEFFIVKFPNFCETFSEIYTI